MRESVRSNFAAFNEPFEARLHYMYLDVKGLVTTGVGNLIDPFSQAQGLPWQVGTDGPAATAGQVQAEWELVKSRQDLKNTPAERAFKPITTLRLSDAAVDGMIATKLAANEASLKSNTAEFASLDEWPADAQLALLSMAWGMGSGFATPDRSVNPPKERWPKFRAAIAARDWTAAAANCDISTTGNPGVVPRNAANRQLFANAQRVVNEGLDPDVLLYPVGTRPSGQQPTPQQPTPQQPAATGRAVFSVGAQCISYDVAGNAAGATAPLADHWKGIDGTGFESGVRAVVSINTATYAFLGDVYIRLHNQVADGGYPLSIAGYWPGFGDAGFGDGVEAAANWGNGKIYFFKGADYIRYDIAANAVDPDYPKSIADNWPGMPNAGFGDGVDSAIVWPNGKAYFFRGDQYVRYDRASDQVDAGYPLPIAGNWPGLSEAGMAGPIDAVWME